MPDLDLSPDTAEAARRGVARVTERGAHGAVQITTDEGVAMAKAITALLVHIGRLEEALADRGVQAPADPAPDTLETEDPQ